jgi:hypothetical protein
MVAGPTARILAPALPTRPVSILTLFPKAIKLAEGCNLLSVTCQALASPAPSCRITWLLGCHGNPCTSGNHGPYQIWWGLDQKRGRQQWGYFLMSPKARGLLLRTVWIVHLEDQCGMSTQTIRPWESSD